MYTYDRTAAVKEASDAGPIRRVLNKWWNEVHDLEYDLEKTIQEYDMAASYVEGPATKDAKAMIKQIEDAIKALDKIVDEGGVFDDLMQAEAKFVDKYGTPDDYAQARRSQMFPR